MHANANPEQAADCQRSPSLGPSGPRWPRAARAHQRHRLVRRAASGLGRRSQAPIFVRREVAGFLRQERLDQGPIVGSVDYIISPIASLLDRRIYYLERGALGSFVIWDARRRWSRSPWNILNAARKQINESVVDGRPGTSCTLVLSSALQDSQDGTVRPLLTASFGDSLRVDLLKSFPAGIVEDEEYFVYSVRRTGGANRR